MTDLKERYYNAGALLRYFEGELIKYIELMNRTHIGTNQWMVVDKLLKAQEDVYFKALEDYKKIADEYHAELIKPKPPKRPWYKFWS